MLGRTGRSVSLADEDHRKMVREIIRNARDPVKNRIIPQNVIDKYVKKITGLQDKAKQVVEEEQAEREIAALENKANRMENQLQNGGATEQDRAWFKTEKQQKKDASAAAKAKKKKNKFSFEDEEEKRSFNEAEFLTRNAKRARKPKKMRTVDDADDFKSSGKKSKGQGKRSAFEDDIVNVKSKNVKRLRHQGNTRQKKRPCASVRKGVCWFWE